MYTDGVFHFGKCNEVSDSDRCNFNMEQVKEIGIQKTKCGVVDEDWIKDTRIYVCKEAIKYKRFIAVKGSWKGKDEDVFLVCIHGPHVGRQKSSLWERLSSLLYRWKGAWCIFEDLNVVRKIDVRLNSQVNLNEITEFSDFINGMRLVKIPMGGRKFTRVTDDGVKFSKLDRFLLNEEFNELWANLSVIALDRKLSDHYSILLKDVKLDFGPKPFWVFNTWLEEHDFLGIVEGAWNKNMRSIHPDCIFQDRLKNVKASLRVWSKDIFGGHKECIKNLEKKALKWELQAEHRGLSDTERVIWMETRKRSSKVGRISMDDAQSLEMVFSENEVWEAIRGCGGDKAPGPDGFNFKRMAFGNKWIKWADTCLRASSMSILVNGSPSEEFQLERGVRQGDPLSLFLFILAVEGLNAIVSKAVEKGILEDKENAKSLMCILKCFEEVSELKVNYNKSKIYGIGVNEEDLKEMARWMGCGIEEFPFIYLGLLVGENMRHIKCWGPVVEKIKKIADWKAKTMSFGGRLTLVKSVLGSLPLHYFLMFRMPLSVIKNLESITNKFFEVGWGRGKRFIR
ncbi:reverse transcriptase domain, reverse transcriptase zinc-binding domain protein [Tanacetum coccineum]|uniref:Reverse transcriptase domain, reverse transcriptase zinc-binding domain protein n=1 Tax=Tanacetum coccineum TaxID=301880 RepID=A0ABQ5BGW9_9ASTR